MKPSKISKKTRRGKLAALLAVTFSASVPFALVGETDVYGNEITVVDGVTYQFWRSGEKAEVASKAGTSELATQGGRLQALFKSVRATLGGWLYSTKTGVLLLFR